MLFLSFHNNYLVLFLRAEMENLEVSVRFGLMLEAYCRGAPTHMKSLQHQVTITHKPLLMTHYVHGHHANMEGCDAINS